eukprot:tig00020537_g10270.t1
MNTAVGEELQRAGMKRRQSEPIAPQSQVPDSQLDRTTSFSSSVAVVVDDVGPELGGPAGASCDDHELDIDEELRRRGISGEDLGNNQEADNLRKLRRVTEAGVHEAAEDGHGERCDQGGEAEGEMSEAQLRVLDARRRIAELQDRSETVMTNFFKQLQDLTSEFYTNVSTCMANHIIREEELIQHILEVDEETKTLYQELSTVKEGTAHLNMSINAG